MTKEQLLALGITEEQIGEIFKLHGLVVNPIKQDLATKETELTTLQGQLTTANKQIEDFRDLNVEEIQKKVEDYKKDYEALEVKAKQDLDSVKFEHTLELALKDAKAKNVKAVKALLDTDSLKESKNREEDIKAAIKATSEENDYLFEDIKPPGTGGSMGNTGNKNKTTITKDQFDQMGYKERIELKSKDSELYNTLKNKGE